MKKLCSVFLFILLIFTTNLNAFAYEEVNVTVENVQGTHIDFVFDKGDLTGSVLSELSQAEINVLESGDNLILRLTVRNAVFAEDFNVKYEKMLQVLEKHYPSMAKELKAKNISIESSFFGYPFGGRTSLFVNGENLEKDINIKINGKYSLNNGNYVSEGIISPSNIPASIEFGVNSIDSLEIKVIPQSNYKSIDVQYTINSSQDGFNEMSPELLAAEGFTVLSKTNELLVIQETYDDLEAFNHLFTLKLGQIFNVIGQVEITASQSLSKTMDAKAMFIESESIDNVTLEIEMLENSKDSVSGHEGKNFKYNITVPTEFNIEFSKVNTTTLLIVILVPVCIIFVVATLLMLGKRSAHIRIK